MTIPSGLLREVFGNDHARELLLLVSRLEEPIRYSQARSELDLHPQQFQRALDKLEGHGLVGLRAPAELNKPHAERDYYVFLETTGIGGFCADLWERMNQGYASLAREQGIPEDALAAATGEE